MEDDIDLFIKDNGQTKPFMLFKNISTSYRLGGICKYYKLGDITYIERENCSRATNLYNMR